MTTCQDCQGKRYGIFTYDQGVDNRLVIQRCDLCSADDFTDEDAAKLAQADGIDCLNTYPCFVVNEVSYVRKKG